MMKRHKAVRENDNPDSRSLISQYLITCGDCCTETNIHIQGRKSSNNFQEKYACRCAKVCVVCCVACYAMGAQSHALVYQGVNDDRNTKGNVHLAKSKHQRNTTICKPAHNLYTKLLSAHSTGSTSTMLETQENYTGDFAVDMSADFDEPDLMEVEGEGELELKLEVGTQFNQHATVPASFPQNILLLHRSFNQLPGSPTLHDQKLPSTKEPERNLAAFSGLRKTAAKPPYTSDFGVRPEALHNVNLNKTPLLGSTTRLREQLDNYYRMPPAKILEVAVNKTFGTSTSLTARELDYFKHVVQLAEQTPTRHWDDIAMVLSGQEMLTAERTVHYTLTEMIGVLNVNGKSGAATQVQNNSKYLAKTLLSNLSAKLHPPAGNVNVSRVCQTGADVRRLMTHVRAVTPVAPYVTVSKNIAGCLLADLVVVALAQPGLDLNAIIPSTVPVNVTSILESKEVVENNIEWASSCMFYYRGGWESLPQEHMRTVLDQAELYNRTRDNTDSTIEFKTPSSDDVFRPSPPNEESCQLSWEIDLQSRVLFISDNKVVRVL